MSAFNKYVPNTVALNAADVAQESSALNRYGLNTKVLNGGDIPPEAAIVQILPSVSQDLQSVSDAEANINATLQPVTQELVGVAPITGSATSTLPALTQELVGQSIVTGNANQTLPALKQQLSGFNGNLGNISLKITPVTQNATGIVPIQGEIESTLLFIESEVEGIVPVSGALAFSLMPAYQFVSGITPASGEIVVTLSVPTQELSGIVPRTGNIAQTLRKVTQELEGVIPRAGDITQTAPAMQQAASGQALVQGTIPQTLPATTQFLNSFDGVLGHIRTDAPSVTQSADGGPVVTGNITQTLPIPGQFVSSPTWAFRGKITAPDGELNAKFGQHVSISRDGNYLAVGAPEATDATDLRAGKVYIYKKVGLEWYWDATIRSHDPSYQGYFGWGVDLSADGSILAVGRPGALNNYGEVSVYTRDGSIWERKATVQGDYANYQYGQKVTISDDGSIVATGAPQDRTSQRYAGAVHIYNFDGGTLTLANKILCPDDVSYNYFGTDLEISGDGQTMVVGCPGYDDEGNNASGAMYILINKYGNWEWHARLLPEIPIPTAEFGTSVSISRDGTKVVGGAPGANTRVGNAYTFTRDQNVWTEEEELSITGLHVNAYFGRSITMSGAGDMICVGCPEEGSDEGSIYVFEYNNGWILSNRIQAFDKESGDEFGDSIEVSDNYSVVVGAWQEDEVDTNAGAAYIYERSIPLKTGQIDSVLPRVKQTLKNLSQGHSYQHLPTVSQEAEGRNTFFFTGDIVQELSTVTQIVGNRWYNITQTAPVVTQALTGDETPTGVVTQTLPIVQQDLGPVCHVVDDLSIVHVVGETITANRGIEDILTFTETIYHPIKQPEQDLVFAQELSHTKTITKHVEHELEFYDHVSIPLGDHVFFYQDIDFDHTQAFEVGHVLEFKENFFTDPIIYLEFLEFDETIEAVFGVANRTVSDTLEFDQYVSSGMQQRNVETTFEFDQTIKYDLNATRTISDELTFEQIVSQGKYEDVEHTVTFGQTIEASRGITSELVFAQTIEVVEGKGVFDTLTFDDQIQLSQVLNLSVSDTLTFTQSILKQLKPGGSTTDPDYTTGYGHGLRDGFADGLLLTWHGDNYLDSFSGSGPQYTNGYTAGYAAGYAAGEIKSDLDLFTIGYYDGWFERGEDVTYKDESEYQRGLRGGTAAINHVQTEEAEWLDNIPEDYVRVEDGMLCGCSCQGVP
jgi:hypothetical protein